MVDVEYWDLRPSLPEEHAKNPHEIYLAYGDNDRSGFFVGSSYVPKVVDPSRMKASLQSLINKNPELAYRFSGSHTMSFDPIYSAVPFLVSNSNLDFHEMEAKLSKLTSPGAVLDIGLMKKFVERKDFFVGDYHQYLGDGRKAKNTPAVAMQLTYDSSGGTWMTMWVMHNFGDGASATRLFYDLIRGYNDNGYTAPKYSFDRKETRLGWDTSKFPPLLHFFFGCCKAKNSWLSHYSMYSPVRACKKIFGHEMKRMRFDINADKSIMDNIKGRLKMKVSAGDILAGFIWMAVSAAASSHSICAALVKDVRDSSAETFYFGNGIRDLPLGDAPQYERIEFSSMAEFIYLVTKGRIGDVSVGQAASTPPNLSISNLTKFDNSSWANIDGVKFESNHGNMIMESLPFFHVHAMIHKIDAGYRFILLMPKDMISEMENTLTLAKGLFSLAPQSKKSVG